MGTLDSIRREVEEMVRHQLERILSKLDLVTRDEFEVQKARLDKIQEEFGKLKKRKKIKKAKKS